MNPLEELAEAVKTKPCSGRDLEHDCKGPVLNVGDKLFDALWQGPAHWYKDGVGYIPGEYVRRSRAESVLGLLKAIPYLGLSSFSTQVMIDCTEDGVWNVVLEEEHEGQADNWPDALADAILKAREASP